MKILRVGLLKRTLMCKECNFKVIKQHKTLFIFGREPSFYYWSLMDWITLLIIALTYPLSKRIFKIKLDFVEKNEK